MTPFTVPDASSLGAITSCRWLPGDLSPLLATTVRIAHGEIGVEENEGRNNSPRIREYLACVGSPVASSWCAAFAWWSVYKAGGRIPPTDAGNVEASRQWAMRNGFWRIAGETPAPLPGWVTIYGEPAHAHHCGVLARVSSLGQRDIEGNTTWSGFSREGTCVAMKPVWTAALLGFITVVPR